MTTREEVEQKISTRWYINPDSENPFENRLLQEKDFNMIMNLIYNESEVKNVDK